jgi:hypothetical protein
LLSCYQYTSIAQLSVTAQAGGLKFLGDVGKKGNANFFQRYATRLQFWSRISDVGKILGVGIDGMYGKLAGTDNDKTSHLNFQSTVMGGAVNVYGFFDKLGEKEKDVAVYASRRIRVLNVRCFWRFKR